MKSLWARWYYFLMGSELLEKLFPANTGGDSMWLDASQDSTGS